ncbi:MAG: hypothetical protein IPL61_31005 [Myxococcales bacterium]|nr:hypothetical protein [Myxococcales bacterium]
MPDWSSEVAPSDGHVETAVVRTNLAATSDDDTVVVVTVAPNGSYSKVVVRVAAVPRLRVEVTVDSSPSAS